MKALSDHGPCPEHRRSFVNVRGRVAVALEADTENSEASNSCYLPGSGQNGPIVEAIEEHGWPTAGLAAMARGA